jgi:hypothetical protein
MPRAAVRVFAPPADRVRELFAGYDSHNHAADRKVRVGLGSVIHGLLLLVLVQTSSTLKKHGTLCCPNVHHALFAIILT